MYILCGMLGLIMINHSFLLLLRDKSIRDTKRSKTFGYITIIVNLIVIISLYLQGLGQITHIILDYILIIPLLIGIYFYMLKKHLKRRRFQ